MKPIKLKSPQEIIDKCKEMIHRHRRRFINRNLTPCPINCSQARFSSGHRVSGCDGCGSSNPEFCRRNENFIPLFSKEELAEQFREDLHNPETLLQNYRDLVVFFFFWCLNIFDMKTIDQEGVSMVEVHDKSK